jgi:hypothetical protein
LGIEDGQVLAYRTAGVAWITQVSDFLARHAATAIRISFDQAGIDRKAFASNQTFLHASLDYALEEQAKRIALAEATVPIPRER